jgi:hypothetical protein
LPKYVHGFIDRHGKPRHYLRKPGHKAIALPGLKIISRLRPYAQRLLPHRSHRPMTMFGTEAISTGIALVKAA